MTNHPQTQSATDAVRCLYLARVAEREGHVAASRRLYTQAAAWIEKYFPGAKAAPACAGTEPTVQG